MLVDGVPTHGLLSSPTSGRPSMAYYAMLSPPGPINSGRSLVKNAGKM